MSVTAHRQSRAHQLLFVQDKEGRYLFRPTRSLHMYATLQVGGGFVQGNSRRIVLLDDDVVYRGSTLCKYALAARIINF